MMRGRRARFSSRDYSGTIRHLTLAFPAVFPTDPQTRFHQTIEILEQVCRQYKKQVPAFAWKPIGATSRELKIILGKSRLNMTQKGDISMIHADKHTSGKRYALQISHDRSNLSLAVAGSRELYDLLIDMNQDGNLLLSHKTLARSAGGKKMARELQLVVMPSDYDDAGSFMYSVSYKQPLKRTAPDRTFKAMQRRLQRLSLTPELHADVNGHAQKITDQEFEKIFGVKLLRESSLDDGIVPNLKHIHSAYRRLQPHIDGRNAFGAGVRNSSLQDVSQKSLLGTIIAQVKKQLLPRVVIVRVNDLVGYGLVAGERIPAGTIIGEYCGEISKVSASGSPDNTYFAAYAPDEVPGSELVVVDARKGGNPTRFINHSDENSNAAWAYAFDGKKFRPVIAAVKPIPKGRQILLKYKDSYWSSKGYDHNDLKDLK